MVGNWKKPTSIELQRQESPVVLNDCLINQFNEKMAICSMRIDLLDSERSSSDPPLLPFMFHFISRGINSNENPTVSLRSTRWFPGAIDSAVAAPSSVDPST